MIANEEFSQVDVDMQVYRTFAMMRCPNSKHPSTGLFKRCIDPDKRLDLIVECIKKDMSFVVPYEARDLEIGEYIERLPDRTEQEGSYAGLQPCIKALWSMPEPPQGYRHKVMHIMARHFFNSGLSQEEANAEFSHHHFYGSACPRDVGNYSSVVRSVYTYGNSAIGCKHGSDGEIMRQYCTKLCMFNDELKLKDLLCGTDSN